MQDLRNHMFAQLERLAEVEKPEEIAQEIQRAQAIGDLGKVLVDSAKAEVLYMKTAGKVKPSEFLGGENLKLEK